MAQLLKTCFLLASAITPDTVKGSDPQCHVDAALTYRDSVYLISNDKYAKLDGGSLKQVKAGKISIFGGLRPIVDAAVTWSGNGRTYFFKGDKYYAYHGLLVGGYRTSAWDPAFEDGIDAAGNRFGQTFFFKGCQVIGMSEKKKLRDETIDLRDLGMQCDVDAAFTTSDAMYVIKGNTIWKWDDQVTEYDDLSDVIDFDEDKPFC